MVSSSRTAAENLQNLEMARNHSTQATDIGADLQERPPHIQASIKQSIGPPEQCVRPWTSGLHTAHSTNPDTTTTSSKSSIDSYAVPSSYELNAMPGNEQHSIRLSKKIQEYELNRGRINGRTKPQQPDLVDDDIHLPTSVTSDWRSMFPDEDAHFSTFTSALLKLLTTPNDALQTALVAFFDTVHYSSSAAFTFSVAETKFLDQLFRILQPHKIPFSQQTIELHSHITSIMFDILHFFTPDYQIPNGNIEYCLIDEYKEMSKMLTSLLPIFRPYLRHLFDHSMCFTGHYGDISFQSFMEVFNGFLGLEFSQSLVPAIRKMYNKIQKDMSDEFFSSLRLVPSDVDPKCQRFDLNMLSDCDWVEVFDRQLVRVGEERPFSALELQSLHSFLSQQPYYIELEVEADGTIRLPKHGEFHPSSTHHAKTLCSLFTPTQPYHAAPLLNSFNVFIAKNNSTSLVTSIWDEWFSNLIAAVDPSTLPFTPDFLPLHAVLVDLMEDRLKRSGICRHSTSQVPSARPRRKLDKFDLSFLELSTDYFIHLSLHPFALEADGFDTIVCFLSSVLSSHLDRNPFIHFRETLIEEMDSSALCSSSPPLILTSELARSLSDKEAIAIVDRIVAHIDSSTFLDDDTLLRIFVFIKHQLRSTRLPELFRKTGRTKDQYFKALESCLSLGLDSLLSHKGQNISTPVFKLFLSWHDYDSPRQGEWKGIYFETIPILMRILGLDQHPCSRNSKGHNYSLNTDQVSRTEHEQSIDHSEKYVMSYFYGQHSETIKDFVLWKDTIARVFCKLGFFIQIVNGLMIHDDSSRSLDFLYAFNRAYGERVQNTAQKREWDHGGKLCVDEEGWEDAMEFVLIPKEKRMTRMYGRMITEQVYVNMSICGANVGRMNR
ncbi:hypothetical protein BLNAU_20942 [Blattamonas nauphoetae]|uniref:Uncharacterized protein n=1 Tax=Blattamonas nauphoetae TaxID=2049346 RepID=A0ABQ9X1D6_9EUKA|nr:hypothetical protein BLNAU_20942 [Blattamonas nauphoetae]